MIHEGRGYKDGEQRGRIERENPKRKSLGLKSKGGSEGLESEGLESEGLESKGVRASALRVRLQLNPSVPGRKGASLFFMIPLERWNVEREFTS